MTSHHLGILRQQNKKIDMRKDDKDRLAEDRQNNSIFCGCFLKVCTLL